jgi:hypothetical protein
MEKQTTVEFIVKELIKLGYLHSNDYGQSPNLTKVIEQAKEMEKQQIIDAFDGFPLSTRNSQNGEEYYTETYKQD